MMYNMMDILLVQFYFYEFIYPGAYNRTQNIDNVNIIFYLLPRYPSRVYSKYIPVNVVYNTMTHSVHTHNTHNIIQNIIPNY